MKKVLVILLVVAVLAGIVYFSYNAISNMSQNNANPVYINEYMSSNKNSIADEDGDHSDWIELYNASNEPVNLEGYTLTDDEKVLDKWKFPNIEIKPKSYMIVFTSGKDRSDPAGKYLHTNFRIDRKGQALYFRKADGTPIDELKTVTLSTDISYGRDKNNRNSWLYFMTATPGNENNTKGQKRLPLDNTVANSDVFITEVMVSNNGGLKDEEDNSVDWIELYNSSDKEVNLNGYALSDDPENAFKWKFPDVSIKPKSYMIVYASGKNKKDPNGNLHLNFKLNKTVDELYFRETEGKIIDHIKIDNFVTNISYGRSKDSKDKWVFYTEATPGKVNDTKEYPGIISDPEFMKKGGHYKETIALELRPVEQGAEIRYTIDGSIPTKDSALYTGPITISKTTVVRAIAIKDGYIPRTEKTQTYFINENHTLPIVSLAVDPKDFDDPVTGMYSMGPGASSEFPYLGANFWKEIEAPAHFEIYEPDGNLGFRFNVGLQIFGGYTRGYPQKSLAIFARDQYEGSEMNYKFVVNKDLTTYKNLVLRTSGQDVNKTKIKDILVTRLIQDNTNIDYMGYRQTVLYINGKYWGIYNLREKINEHFIANNHGIENVENIDILEGQNIVKYGRRDEYDAMIEFIKNNDISKKENYEKVKNMMDIQSYIDYEIIQMYIGNIDGGNVRYWKERKEGAKWRWIVYDMDLGFQNVDHDTVAERLNPLGSGANNMFSTLLIRKLLTNAEFKQEFLERFAFHLKNTFNTERVLSLINELAGNIESEMARNFERWDKPSIEDWEKQIFNLQYFAQKRVLFVKSHLKKNLNLTDEQMKIFE